MAIRGTVEKNVDELTESFSTQLFRGAFNHLMGAEDEKVMSAEAGGAEGRFTDYMSLKVIGFFDYSRRGVI